MSKIVTKFELFLENQKYSDSKIKSFVKQNIKSAMKALKDKVKKATSIDEVKELSKLLPKEIDNIKKHLTGTIIMSINEKLNEASVFAVTLDMLKSTFKELILKKDTVLEKAKKDLISQINHTEELLLKELKELNLDVEKSSAKMAKATAKIYEPKFL